ncbi:MAG: hypothetical protein JSR46_01805 [Verrucomicrobia bacterium]|nr:hypothetical protein [Verrucomicrobiota bacterium]
MEMASKALYNSLRISVLQDPGIVADDWQIEDYRMLPLEGLFRRLEDHEIFLDRASFMAYADEHDSPEELLAALISEDQADTEESDRIYLLIFEIWRKLVPEKQSVSLICDELDYQIFLFDEERLERREPLEDALAAFYSTLVENLDSGLSEKEIFLAISEYCAHDLPSFLYDYISDLLDQREHSFASELLEQFYPFVPDKLWFDFLCARIVGINNTRQASQRIRMIIQETQRSSYLALNFEILTYLSHGIDIELFREVAHLILLQVESEEDLQDLFSTTADFFESYGDKNGQKQIGELLANRKDKSLDGSLVDADPDIEAFKKVLQIT